MTEHTKGERAYFNPSYAHQGEATMNYICSTQRKLRPEDLKMTLFTISSNDVTGCKGSLMIYPLQRSLSTYFLFQVSVTVTRRCRSGHGMGASVSGQKRRSRRGEEERGIH